ncbi:unnamed protein product [Allacma fusca]|uniref:Uncharacterized protein n=1 Tax=Allacma fusca TaxID=39272 RepID=A0A8J2PLX0_9HEXA|nr:unnamed protein product [Allacma fusca]
MKSRAMRVVICFIALSFAGTAISRGVTGGGGGSGGSGGNSSGGGRQGLSSRLFSRNVSPYKAPNQTKNKDAGGAYLIPAGGGSVFPIYKAQEVTSYYRREGTGMSAWGIVALILGVIGSGTVAWFCYMVGLPIWRDRQRRHSLIGDPIHRPQHEGIPLQETPSTATPSPCIAVCLPS